MIKYFANPAFGTINNRKGLTEMVIVKPFFYWFYGDFIDKIHCWREERRLFYFSFCVILSPWSTFWSTLSK